MLTKVVVVVLMVAAALAAEQEGEREKRQVHCATRFELTSDPCQSGQSQRYFPVPGDNTKFVQCDVMGRAYVVQCPSGMSYSQVTTSCQNEVTTSATPGVGSVCTPQAIRSGNIYFPFPGDNSKFYQCIGVYQVQEMPCTPGTVWANDLVACNYPSVPSGPITGATPNSIQPFTNPCTVERLTTEGYYYSHPDPTKFIQCDGTGQAFEMQCPNSLVWNQYDHTCASIYAGLPSVVA